MEETIAAMKKAGGKGGEWKTFSKMKIRYTIITKDWKYEERTHREWMLAPLGMVDALTRRLNAKSTYNQAKFISPEVKFALEISDDATYAVEKMSIDVSNLGDLGEKEFQHISCKVCAKDFIPAVIKMNKGKLPDEPKLCHLIANWDKLKLPPTLMDLAGCFFAREPHVNSGPNGRRFIQRPTEHTPLHAKIKLQLEKPESSQSRKQQQAEASSSSKSNSTDNTSDPQSTLTGDEGVLSVKVAKKVTEVKDSKTNILFHKGLNVVMEPLQQSSIFSSLNAIELKSPCKDDIENWAKRTMFRMIHGGVNKMISNEASLELYELHLDGAHDYHNAVLKKVRVNELSIPPPRTNNKITKTINQLRTDYTTKSISILQMNKRQCNVCA